jgi:hypothetical protein
MVKLNLNLTNEQKSLIKSIITRVPKNEEEVKRIFYKLEDTLSFQDVKAFDLFPDASAFYKEKEIYMEFEYHSSNFKKHKHKEKDCDIIICWEDDDSSLKIPVLELSTLVENWLKVRQELMMEYTSCLSAELGSVENKGNSYKERAKEIESLMGKYNFDQMDAVACTMSITKPTLHRYYYSLEDPECVGGPLECEKRDIDPKYLGIKTSLKAVPIVLCKNCQNKVKCSLGNEQRIGYYFSLGRKNETPRKIYFDRKQIENEKILSYAKMPHMNLWKNVQFKRR